MEDDCATASVSDRSTVLPDSKSEKRAGFGFEEKSELERKRFKLQPFSAQGTWKNNEVESAKEGISNVTKETLVTKSNINQSIGLKPDRSLLVVDRAPLDLNTKYTTENSKISGQNIKSNTDFAKPKHFVLDLNEQDASSSINKSSEHINSKDAVECESSVGTFEPKDPMKVWKEMKQNGFLSSSNSGMPAPKPRGRKSKTDVFKKKIELAKKEQVDRFAKVAAPSGLLNGLNPGIINHVRNSKQVHSIIEALVRSEERENRRAKNASKDCSEKKGQENLSDIGMKRIFAHGLGILDDKVAMKMSASSTNVASEISSSLSNEDSRNLTADSALSIKAANVAFQWLELLHQDIKGRLTALRRSKKRVRAVIETELPFLMSKEFFSQNQENEPCNIMRTCGLDNKAAHVHRARWSPLFDQMEKALCEEECQLDSWLNQVKEMKLQCGNGLYQHLNTTENGWTRVEKVDNHDADLAISAAAASVYSTCNFLQSMENIPCL